MNHTHYRYTDPAARKAGRALGFVIIGSLALLVVAIVVAVVILLFRAVAP